MRTLQSLKRILKIFLPTKSRKNHPQKLLRIPQIHLFPYCPDCPNSPTMQIPFNISVDKWSFGFPKNIYIFGNTNNIMKDNKLNLKNGTIRLSKMHRKSIDYHSYSMILSVPNYETPEA